MDIIEGTIPGHILGALFVLWILAMIWETCVFKHVTSDPVVGKLLAAAAAWLTAFLARIWGGIDTPGAFGDFNLIAAAILCGIAVWEGLKLRETIGWKRNRRRQPTEPSNWPFGPAPHNPAISPARASPQSGLPHANGS